MDNKPYSWNQQIITKKFLCPIVNKEISITICAIAENDNSYARWHSVDCSKDGTCEHYKFPNDCEYIRELKNYCKLNLCR